MLGSAIRCLALFGAVAADAATEQAREDVYCGIDLGTTTTCAYIYHPTTKVYENLIMDNEGHDMIPSTVYLSKIDENNNPVVHIGHEANQLNEAAPDSDRYAYGFKRIMGVPDLASNPQLVNFQKHVTYKVEAHRESVVDPVTKQPQVRSYQEIVLKANGKEYRFTPTMLSSLVLQHVMKRLEAKNYNPLRTFITTPAYFNPIQDQETVTAAEMVGFKNVKIEKEPVAACAAYAETADLRLDNTEKVLVFDFGGGTLDISVVEVTKEADEAENGATKSQNIYSNLSVNKVVGDNFLGGENVNNELVKFFQEHIESNYKNQISFTNPAMNNMLRLRLFTEEFKLKLCNAQNEKGDAAEISSDFISGENVKVTFKMTGAKFNEVAAPVFKRIDALFNDPVTGLFRKSQGDIHSSIVDPQSIGKIILVGGSSRIAYLSKYLSGIRPNVPLYTRVDTDKAVAHGAAIMCVMDAAAPGDASITVSNIVPLPIGIKVVGDLFEPIIHDGEVIPTYSTKTFTTVQNNQPSIHLCVAAGVRPRYDQNEHIGDFVLHIDPAPAGVPKIEVRVDYNYDFSFQVTATDQTTQKKVSKSFSSAYGNPPKDKIAKMLTAAKENKEKDDLVRKLAEESRGVRAAVDELEASLNAATKLSEEDRAFYRTLISDHREFLDKQALDSTSEVLATKLAAVKEQMEDLQKRVAASTAGETPDAPTGTPEEPLKETRDVL